MILHPEREEMREKTGETNDATLSTETDWDRTVVAHPQLNGTDKLVYHLLKDFPVQQVVARMIGKDSRIVRRSVHKLRRLGLDPLAPVRSPQESERTHGSSPTGPIGPDTEPSTGPIRPIPTPATGPIGPPPDTRVLADDVSSNARPNLVASPSGEAFLSSYGTLSPSPRVPTSREGKGIHPPYQLQFAHMPSPRIRQQLKRAGFTYNGATQVWTAEEDTALVRRLVHQLADGTISLDGKEVDPENGNKATDSSPPASLDNQPLPPASLPATDPRLEPVFTHLQEQIRPQAFQVWFHPVRLTVELCAPGWQVTCWTPSPTASQWIARRYADTMRTLCQEVLGEKVFLHFQPEVSSGTG